MIKTRTIMKTTMKTIIAGLLLVCFFVSCVEDNTLIDEKIEKQNMMTPKKEGIAADKDARV